MLDYVYAHFSRLWTFLSKDACGWFAVLFDLGIEHAGWEDPCFYGFWLTTANYGRQGTLAGRLAACPPEHQTKSENNEGLEP